MQDKFLTICMIIDAWDPIVGGGQIHVENICKLLTNNYNCNIDLFVRNLPGGSNNNISTINKNFRIIKIGPKLNFFNPIGRLIWMFSPIIPILKHNKAKNYSLIHAHAYFAAIPAKIISLFLKRPIVFTVHGSNLMDINIKSLRYQIEKLLLTKIKYTVEISTSSKFLEYRNVNKVVVIPNGVDLKLFDNISCKKNMNEFRTLYVGRFDKVKGVDILLRAIYQVLNKGIGGMINKRVKFVLVGYGYEEKDLRRYVERNYLSRWVEFTGKLSFKKTIEQYKKADLFVLPSRAEGQPLTILEAWAAKIPVIATDVGDNHAYINNNVNGYIVSKDNIMELSSAILKAMQNPNLNKLGENGYRNVSQKYQWKYCAKQTYHVYKDCLSV